MGRPSEDQVHQAVTKSFGKKIGSRIGIVQSIAQIVPIDDLELAPLIIKIDAEGFDYEVLLGAKRTIEAFRPFIMVEVVHNEIAPFQDYFRKLNYRMLAFDFSQDMFSLSVSNALAYETGSRNLFAVPNEHLGVLPVS